MATSKFPMYRGRSVSVMSRCIAGTIESRQQAKRSAQNPRVHWASSRPTLRSFTKRLDVVSVMLISAPTPATRRPRAAPIRWTRQHRGPKWNDGDFYKWLESASAIVGATKDKKLEAQLDQLIDLIARTQEKDGYIHTDVQISQRTGSDKPRF